MQIKYAWIGITLAVLTGVLTGWLLSRVAELPDIETLEAYRPGEVSRIFADDDTLMEELFIEKREVIPFERLWEYVLEELREMEKE